MLKRLDVSEAFRSGETAFHTTFSLWARSEPGFGGAASSLFRKSFIPSCFSPSNVTSHTKFLSSMARSSSAKRKSSRLDRISIVALRQPFPRSAFMILFICQKNTPVVTFSFSAFSASFTTKWLSRLPFPFSIRLISFPDNCPD